MVSLESSARNLPSLCVTVNEGKKRKEKNKGVFQSKLSLIKKSK